MANPDRFHLYRALFILALVAAAVVYFSLETCRKTEVSPSGSRSLGGEGFTGQLQIVAAEGIAPAVERQALSFERVYPNTDVTVMSAPARAALVALQQGTANIAVIDRPLTEREQAALLSLRVVQTQIATDALAVVVATANPAQALDAAAFQRLLAGEPVTWADLGGAGAPAGSPQLALPSANAGLVEALSSRFMPDGESPRPTAALDSEADVIEWLNTTPNGVGVVSLRVLRESEAAVHALGVPDSTGTPVLPTPLSVYEGTYPWTRPVLLLTTGAAQITGAGFATFVLGTQGQESIQRAGLAPVVIPSREIEVH